MTSTPIPFEGIWSVLACLQTLSKIKVFAWKACHEALPTRYRRAQAGLDAGICSLCDDAVETYVHALRDCPHAKEVLVVG
ncbi:hypothetical protein V6N11_037768 [Hibiscus sabdariffa]|uniref:Reverse transcriptase zinc-binding domain-containing protein n=1 Tax=Hibiscus sabdariffa TaxID=183260 RepID=A0ABR2PEG5_9ROSI